MDTVLATNNETWGFWGTTERNGYPVELAWEAASRFLAARFELSAVRTRDLLDSRFGRHLADDLSFAGADLTAEIITAHLEARFSPERRDWVRWVRTALRDLDAQHH